MQQIAIPVVLCHDEEMKPYLAAKRGLEAAFARERVEVGAFFFQLGSSLRPDSVRRTVANSERVRTVATQRAFVPDYALKRGGGLDHIRAPLEVIAALKNRKADVWLDFHIGVRALDRRGAGRIASSKKEIASQIVQSLGEAADMAGGMGLGLLLESTPPLTVEGSAGEATPTAYAFATLPDLLEIRGRVGRGNLGVTFDIAALASLRAARRLDPALRGLAAQINGFGSWAELTAAYGTVGEWTAAAREYHISNATGVSAHVPDPTFRRRYGVMGTVRGALTSAEVRGVLRAAREKSAVCCVEVELNLEKLTFNEVRRFLSWAYGK